MGTPRESEPVPQSTSLPSLSTSPLRFSSSQEMPPRTTRRPESSQDTSNSLSETTRSSTDSLRTPPSPPEGFSHTSTLSSSRPQETREESEQCLISYLSTYVKQTNINLYGFNQV